MINQTIIKHQNYPELRDEKTSTEVITWIQYLKSINQSQHKAALQQHYNRTKQREQSRADDHSSSAVCGGAACCCAGAGSTFAVGSGGGCTGSP
jgi:hypothetical protein